MGLDVRWVQSLIFGGGVAQAQLWNRDSFFALSVIQKIGASASFQPRLAPPGSLRMGLHYGSDGSGNGVLLGGGGGVDPTWSDSLVLEACMDSTVP